jgi:hypothetical protein
MVRQGEQGGKIVTLPQEQETIHSEIIRDKGIHYPGRKFLANIQAKERGMTAYARPKAVAYVDCQTDPVRDFLQDHGCHLRDVLYHLPV